MEKKSKRGVLFDIYVRNLILVMVTVILTGTACIYIAVRLSLSRMDRAIKDTSFIISHMEEVGRLLKKESGSMERENLLRFLDEIKEKSEYVDIIVIADTEGIRHYHSEHEKIGEHFVGGDEGAVLSGAEPYITNGEGSLGFQRRAFSAVYDGDRVIGFVMASVLTSNLNTVVIEIIWIFGIVMIILMGTGIFFAPITSGSIRKALQDYGPEDFVKMYMDKNRVIDNLEDGILAIDAEGEVTICNGSARKIFFGEDTGGAADKNSQKNCPDERLLEVIGSGKAEYNVTEIINGNNILSSRVPLYENNKLTGAILIMRNKTEVTKLAEKLTGANYMVDTLRAFNHEFNNKLHVILGYLEVGDFGRAKEYIVNTSLVSSESVSEILHKIPIQNLAALLIGKQARAFEMGIRLSIKPDTCFEQKENELPSDCYITLVGNLINNAIDELNGSEYPVKNIELGIYSTEKSTIITCDDTGGGIPEDILFSIYSRETTTKGFGHGSGFAIMKEIVDAYGGIVHIDTEMGEGTSIEIILPL